MYSVRGWQCVCVKLAVCVFEECGSVFVCVRLAVWMCESGSVCVRVAVCVCV